MRLALRCYAYGRDGDWEAICTDLDIAVFGASLPEVEASLRTAVDLYLETVSELPDEERRRLLARRAPLHVRAKLATLTWLQRLRGHRDRRQGFVLQPQVPAHP